MIQDNGENNKPSETGAWAKRAWQRGHGGPVLVQWPLAGLIHSKQGARTDLGRAGVDERGHGARSQRRARAQEHCRRARARHGCAVAADLGKLRRRLEGRFFGFFICVRAAAAAGSMPAGPVALLVLAAAAAVVAARTPNLAQSHVLAAGGPAACLDGTPPRYAGREVIGRLWVVM